MILIQIDEHTRIESDTYNYIISEETKERKKNPKTGKTEYTGKYTGNYKQNYFFRCFEHLLAAYLDQRGRKIDSFSLTEHLKKLEAIKANVRMVGVGVDKKIGNMGKEMAKQETSTKLLLAKVKTLEEQINEAKG